ncbi:hypothetical protein [Kibdelosporangium phytohabitans]|uniref:Uncharacterized protein n=1 Tax=Kibdelosporangium phytohabitans TaxID=860235 RepID=A0A0N9IA75_9PSEU|nr:hypothetical protein [Kibdelosporangium phytohabitans]ALG11973.1 hypothetical protein AOZ06_38460 [Kibdelosporangium phytohabitans]MBE1463438.1 hypothetical protein [Kibdelosporangium phytohabitans]
MPVPRCSNPRSPPSSTPPLSGLGWFIESLNRDGGGDGRMLCLTQRWIRCDVIRVVFESTLGTG